jgi:L-asparaginase/Glu-tRNA(Gln) amidotransferase subunit D
MARSRRENRAGHESALRDHHRWNHREDSFRTHRVGPESLQQNGPIPAALRLPSADVRVVQLLNKDSLEINDSDRQLILGTVRALVPENAAIVITHGTDTMVQTGMFLQAAMSALTVPIIPAGAMVPLGFGSGALQNLTESLFAARFLNPGVCA